MDRSGRLNLGKSEVLYYIYSALSKTAGLHEGEATVADEEEVLAFLLQSLQQHFGFLDLLQVHICPQTITAITEICKAPILQLKVPNKHT